MPRFLVTGGAGFIGSHLCERLLGGKNNVIAVDNLSTGTLANLDSLKKEPRFEFIRGDVAEKIPDVGKVDGVLHFASPASPWDFVPLAIEILKVGSLGTFHAIEYAHKHGAWFFMASTSEVYGDPKEHPQKETYLGNVSTTGVRSVYDESKRFSEAVTAAYRRKHKLPVSIVRIFNTYGPRMRPNDGRVVPNFISQALQGEPITIYGDGSQTRSFCYVDDLVDGLVRFVDKRPSDPINLGNDRETSIREIAETIVRLCNSKSGFVSEPFPEGDPKLRCPDLTRAKKILGWSPKTSLEAGLRKTIDYFRIA
ncbi:MAG: UDP-glucuronic acid decarboxylase family protein [Pseudomonadota bacterium]